MLLCGHHDLPDSEKGHREKTQTPSNTFGNRLNAFESRLNAFAYHYTSCHMKAPKQSTEPTAHLIIILQMSILAGAPERSGLIIIVFSGSTNASEGYAYYFFNSGYQYSQITNHIRHRTARISDQFVWTRPITSKSYRAELANASITLLTIGLSPCCA